MGLKIGYARVSTREQNLDGQVDMLNQVGCERLFTDKTSGITQHRPGWDDLMAYVRPGDTIVVAELSRMTRSLSHLLQLAQVLETKKINLTSLREAIDTTTATGRAFLAIMGAINQMERELKAERAAAGRAAAKARGRSGGRPKTDHATLERARILYETSDYSADEACKPLGIGRRTFFRYLEERRKTQAEAKPLD
ncbi:recombinase family protein [Geomonas ferrireducens]|uniref:recombinase family protein n=1 Tax=Geomonas ferrireducens TaxID=2570227 RepID=UPI0010A87433|nr:recombinase family protein [Geomonas ferrireducens]